MKIHTTCTQSECEKETFTAQDIDQNYNIWAECK